MTIEKRNDYRVWIESDYSARRAKNPRLSLRSYAKWAGLSPSLLSEVLSRKAGLSEAKALRMAEKMGLNPQETEMFCGLVARDHSRSHRIRSQAAARVEKSLSDFPQITMDAFSAISDWYHFTILELVLTKDFTPSPKWISMRLGITEIEAKNAIDRLTRLGLIEISEKGEFIVADETHTPLEMSSSAIRKFHSQVLTKALEALDEQSVEERDFGAMILAVNESDLNEAKKDLRAFRQEFNKKYGAHQGAKKEEVYVLSTPMFRLTKKGLKKETKNEKNK